MFKKEEIEKVYFLEEDSELVKRLNRGDHHAFTELYQKYLAKVYGFLNHLLSDETLAEDITQYCFMQIWTHRKKISSERSFSSYLYVMARNAAYMEFRRQITADRYVDYAIRNQNEFEKEDYGKVDMKIIEKEIRRVIAALPESRRNIYLMSSVKGMKASEIAVELGVSVKTVEAQISRVRIALRNAVSKIILLLFIA